MPAIRSSEESGRRAPFGESRQLIKVQTKNRQKLSLKIQLILRRRLWKDKTYHTNTRSCRVRLSTERAPDFHSFSLLGGQPALFGWGVHGRGGREPKYIPQ
jgi:hypothetical protein